MKNFLSILLLAGAATAPVLAHMNGCSSEGYSTQSSMESSSSSDKGMMPKGEMMENMMRDMMALKKKISGKTLEFPGSLVKEAMDLKAKMLRMDAEDLRKCGELNFKAGSMQAKQHDQAAQKLEAAASALQNLPVGKTVKKRFDNVRDWMKLMIEKKELKARFLKEIADQLGDSDMKRKVDKLSAMIQKHKDMMNDMINDMMSEDKTSKESQEGTAGSGCSAASQDDQDQGSQEMALEEDGE